MSSKESNQKVPAKQQNGLAVTKEYIITQKFKEWTRLFFDIKNKDTYGNATKCALRVYNTEDYHSAGQIGHENLKKLENISVKILDDQGFGLADLMRIGASKMLAGSYDDWEKFMIRLGYFDTKQDKSDHGAVVNVQNIINDWK